MQKLLLSLLTPLLLSAGDLSIEKETLNQIGMQVWQNECRGTLDGLISWNPTEEFPSLGLGHFIWYPAGSQHKFEEGFPILIGFLSEKLADSDIKIPSWIKSKKGFPWKTREAFLKDKRSKKVAQLRELLSSTLDLQILFLFEQFKGAEQKLLPSLSAIQKVHLEILESTPKGMYALVDYLNFKGLGLSEKERYRGEGWGLLQVLQNLPADVAREKTVEAFATSAKQILSKRVKNAPIHRKEDQYLKGWFKRLETYTDR